MTKTILFLIILILLINFRVILVSSAEQEYFIMISTGYCPCEKCCYPHADGITFTGAEAGKGCIAIDPDARILRMGQKLYIDGYGYGIANDVGGAIKGWEVDLCFDTHQEALAWGVRKVKVYIILKEGK